MRGYDTRRIGLLVGLLLLLAAPALAQVTVTPAPVPSCVASDTLVYNGTTWTCAASAVSLPISDASNLLKDNADATKIARFELSGLTTGTTRIMSWPDCNLDLSVTTANRVLATGAAGAGCGAYRALVAADIPSIDGSKITGAGSLGDSILSANIPKLNIANAFAASGNSLLGNTGVGTSDIEAWNSSYRALQFPIGAIFGGTSVGAGSFYLADNAYYDGAWKYRATGEASNIQLASGSLTISTAASGSADAAISFTARAALNNSGAWRWYAYGAGTATFDASGNITSVSDERMKDVLGPFTPGLNAVMGLRSIRWRYTAASGLDDENVYAGFSAQNVMGFIPEAVGKNLDGLYSLNIVPVLAATVTAVQELAREVDELRAASGLPAKNRVVAPVTGEQRIVTSATPKRLAEIVREKAAADAAKAREIIK